jgi:hypothetical protein
MEAVRSNEASLNIYLTAYCHLADGAVGTAVQETKWQCHSSEIMERVTRMSKISTQRKKKAKHQAEACRRDISRFISNLFLTTLNQRKKLILPVSMYRYYLSCVSERHFTSPLASIPLNVK